MPDRIGGPTPPSGWEPPDAAAAHRSTEQVLTEMIALLRQLLTVAQIMLDLAEERVTRDGTPRTRSTEPPREVDIPIL